jgi:hypothetical protein
MLQGLALKGRIWRNSNKKPLKIQRFILWLVQDLKHPADFNIHSRKGKPFFAQVFE